ncbi:hypothetical protein IJ182_11465 [bacterium]|nr:hypothetical protein [bacterium]
MDYWARLLQGNAFLQLGHILKFDPFSYTPTHIWLDHEWGSGVIFSFIQNTFSFDMVLFFRAFIIFLIFFLLYKIIKIRSGIKFNAYSILYFIFALYAIPTISMSGLRCHFLTFLFFTLFLYILELVRKRNKNGLLFILPFVMLIWCNCHGGCVSGLGLLFLYAVGEYLNKKLCAKYVYTLIGCIIIMFINPYGIDYVKFIFMAATMERPFVTEWISPFLHPVPTFMLYFKLFFVLNFVLFIFSVKQIKYDYTKYLILCVCAYLSCRYVKNTPFIVITSIAFLYDDLIFLIEKYLPEGINKISQTRHISVLLVFVLILYNVYSLLKIPNSWNYLSQQPYKVTLFIQNNKLNGKILAPFDYGSYLAYKLYPNNLIYMDGRYEEVYFNSTKKLLDDFFNVQNEGYKVLDDKPEYVIVPSNALVNDYLIQLDDYKLIYKDETDCLYAYKENLKNEYINVPDEEQLKTYIKQQYVMNPSFKYTDDIFINGKKVVFK